MDFDEKERKIRYFLNDLRNVVINAEGGVTGYKGERLFIRDEEALEDIMDFMDDILVLVKSKAADYKNFKPARNPNFPK